MPEESRIVPSGDRGSYGLVNYNFFGIRIKSEHVSIPLLILFFSSASGYPSLPIPFPPPTQDSRVDAVGLKLLQWREWLLQQGAFAVSLVDPDRNVLPSPLLVTPSF